MQWATGAVSWPQSADGKAQGNLAHVKEVASLLNLPQRAIYDCVAEQYHPVRADPNPALFAADQRLDRQITFRGPHPFVKLEHLLLHPRPMPQRFLRLAPELSGRYEALQPEGEIRETLREFMQQTMPPGTKWVKDGDGYMLVPTNEGKYVHKQAHKPCPARSGFGFGVRARTVTQFKQPNLHESILGLQPVIDHLAGHRGMQATPELEVWRTLHVEVDSLGLVAGNTVTGEITQVGQPDWGNMTVTVTTDQFLNDSPDRFVPGQLTSNNRDFNVVANTVGDNFTVTVRFYTGPGGLPAEGPFILLDDDTLVDGMDVPMPDTSELKNAMAEAYVDVLYDVGDANDATVFQANLVSDTHYLAARDWDSQAGNYDEFWVTYLLGGYQGPLAYDNDPDAENPLYGWISSWGGSVVFLETLTDVSREIGVDAGVFERDRVVADVGRTLARVWGNDNDAFQSQTPVTGWPSQPARYTGEYLWRIRNSPRPLGL
jgi:hypothetical protein